MSFRVGNVAVICEQPDARCSQCGEVTDVRPYGPNGAMVCYDCAMKDPKGTQRRMNKELFGENEA